VPHRQTTVAASLILLAAAVLPSRAQTTTPSTTPAPLPLTVTIDTQSVGTEIPPDFTGVSLEIQTLLPNKEGVRYFRPDNQPLLAMFKTLGIHNLRVGGNTADNPAVKVPGPKDIDSLFAFAKAARVPVIYTLRLRNSTNPEADASVAKYVMGHYASQVVCFEIGNEPNIYAKTYPEYKKLFTSFVAAIKRPDWAPEITFCGPNTTPDKADWASKLANDFGSTGPVSLITQHAYFGGDGHKVKDPVASRRAMLSTQWPLQYQKMVDAFVPECVINKLPWRIEETNSFYNGGAKDVSNTHAAALWALDYLYWWASKGAAGINFHTGDHVAAGDASTPCWYAAYWTSPDGYNAHPVGYAMKAFDLGSRGALVPAKLSGGDWNLTAYAVVGQDKNLYLTLINKEAEHPEDATVTIAADGYDHPQLLPLVAANNDLASTDTETLGGARITDDGTWTGNWTPATGTTITVPATSAVIVRLAPR
jgi:hypothetical protein